MRLNSDITLFKCTRQAQKGLHINACATQPAQCTNHRPHVAHQALLCGPPTFLKNNHSTTSKCLSSNKDPPLLPLLHLSQRLAGKHLQHCQVHHCYCTVPPATKDLIGVPAVIAQLLVSANPPEASHRFQHIGQKLPDALQPLTVQRPKRSTNQTGTHIFLLTFHRQIWIQI